MRLTRITSHVDEETNALRSLTVVHEGGPANGRVVQVAIGKDYLVQPLNPQKLKHRGRRCTVRDWVYDDIGNPVAVSVQFQDNKRLGRVDVVDLAEG